MLATDTSIFLQLPSDSGQRILHAGKILSSEGERYRAEFEEADLSVEPESDALLYYELRRRFMQQAARIETVERTESQLVVELVPTSEPVSAESRQCYRVSCIAANLTVDFGDETGCPVLDVSATGFSCYASEKYRAGDRIQVVMHHDVELAGMVVIQSVRTIKPGKIRYGVHCVDKERGGGVLKHELTRVSLDVQRQQLRRMSGG